ncbi:MAG: hypothetical protein H6R10_3103 [Rhodocyclaceae bacterium]|nr:hypothetical protein [Rhodocyclaceae bacterium]
MKDSSEHSPFDTLRRLAREDGAAYCRERRRLIDEYLQSRACDALGRLQDEVDWLRAMERPAAEGWPEIWELLQERVAALADKVNLLARELNEAADAADKERKES